MSATLAALQSARLAHSATIQDWYDTRDAEWTPGKDALLQLARERCSDARIAENAAWLAHYRPDLAPLSA